MPHDGSGSGGKFLEFHISKWNLCCLKSERAGFLNYWLMDRIKKLDLYYELVNLLDSIEAREFMHCIFF